MKGRRKKGASKCRVVSRTRLGEVSGQANQAIIRAGKMLERGDLFGAAKGGKGERGRIMVVSYYLVTCGICTLVRSTVQYST